MFVRMLRQCHVDSAQNAFQSIPSIGIIVILTSREIALSGANPKMNKARQTLTLNSMQLLAIQKVLHRLQRMWVMSNVNNMHFP